MNHLFRLILILSLIIFVLVATVPQNFSHQSFEIKEKLSEYDFFEGKIALQIPKNEIIPYQLNTPLFSDYAEKLRFVKIPQGEKIFFQAETVFDFPIGTILIKTFYYPLDFRKPEKGRKLIETRLLIREKETWKALTYIWNEEQTDALLEVAGDTKKISWINQNGKKIQIDYAIPNINQCKGCHNNNEKLMPIGPSARQLNGDFQYASGQYNQLKYWHEKGILKDLPELANIPKTPIWNDATSGTLEARARAWLDINCAHCHSAAGPAKTSGLILDWKETNPTKLGIWKTPVAAGKGSGGLKYSIVPQKPDESILLYRIQSTDPSEMMPELGRKMAHQEGVALIKEWIKSLK